MTWRAGTGLLSCTLNVRLYMPSAIFRGDWLLWMAHTRERQHTHSSLLVRQGDYVHAAEELASPSSGTPRAPSLQPRAPSLQPCAPSLQPCAHLATACAQERASSLSGGAIKTDGDVDNADLVRRRVQDLTRLAEMRWKYRVVNKGESACGVAITCLAAAKVAREKHCMVAGATLTQQGLQS